MAKQWFMGLFSRLKKDNSGNISLLTEGHELMAEVYYKKLAIETAINLIANTLSLCEFKTFSKGKEIKGAGYYLFNIEPNGNQNANRFWRKAIHKMVYDNEALILMQDEKIYVAESFTRTQYAFRSNVYSGVVVDDFRMDKIFNEDEVFYLALHSEKMKHLIDGLYRDYGKLIEHSKKTYKRSNAMRGLLELPTNLEQTPQGREKLDKLINEQMKKFFNAENGAVLPLSNGIKYTDLTNQTYKNGSDSRDIRSLVDDVFDYVAVAFQIPPQLLKGAVADSDKSFDNFMSFCIKPWAELIEKEINRKYYGKDDYLKKSYVKIDVSMIKAISIKELAGAIDILTRNGVNTLNDNLKMMGREELDDKIGSQRFVTLNLTPMEKILKGGEESEKRNN